MDTTVQMTVGQLREIKMQRYFIAPIEAVDESRHDYDYLFFKNYACMIHRITGETLEYNYKNLWIDYTEGTEGLPNDLIVNAPVKAYRAWLETKGLDK